MCRSIKTLREPFTEDVTAADVHAAALQYVRKVSGFRKPAAHNAEAFDRAVDAVAGATAMLLETLEVRGAPHAHPHQHEHDSGHEHQHDHPREHEREPAGR